MSNPNEEELSRVVSSILIKVTEETNDELLRPFTREEIVKVVKGFHLTKTPGPDGFPSLFFQKYWEIVRDQTVSDCLDILNNDRGVKDWNHTHIAFIPKVRNPRLVTNFRQLVFAMSPIKL